MDISCEAIEVRGSRVSALDSRLRRIIDLAGPPHDI